MEKYGRCVVYEDDGRNASGPPETTTPDKGQHSTGTLLHQPLSCTDIYAALLCPDIDQQRHIEGNTPNLETTHEDAATVGSIQDLSVTSQEDAAKGDSIHDLSVTRHEDAATVGSIQDLPITRHDDAATEGSIQDLPVTRHEDAATGSSIPDITVTRHAKWATELFCNAFQAQGPTNFVPRIGHTSNGASQVSADQSTLYQGQLNQSSATVDQNWHCPTGLDDSGHYVQNHGHCDLESVTNYCELGEVNIDDNHSGVHDIASRPICWEPELSTQTSDVLDTHCQSCKDSNNCVAQKLCFDDCGGVNYRTCDISTSGDSRQTSDSDCECDSERGDDQVGVALTRCLDLARYCLRPGVTIQVELWPLLKWTLTTPVECDNQPLPFFASYTCGLHNITMSVSQTQTATFTVVPVFEWVSVKEQPLPYRQVSSPAVQGDKQTESTADTSNSTAQKRYGGIDILKVRGSTDVSSKLGRVTEDGDQSTEVEDRPPSHLQHSCQPNIEPPSQYSICAVLSETTSTVAAGREATAASHSHGASLVVEVSQPQKLGTCSKHGQSLLGNEEQPGGEVTGESSDRSNQHPLASIVKLRAGTQVDPTPALQTGGTCNTACQTDQTGDITAHLKVIHVISENKPLTGVDVDDLHDYPTADYLYLCCAANKQSLLSVKDTIKYGCSQKVGHESGDDPEWGNTDGDGGGRTSATEVSHQLTLLVLHVHIPV